MAIKWLVQDTDRHFSIVDDDFLSLKKLGFNVINFGTIPFTKMMTGIEGLSPDDDYILRCGTKIVDLIEKGEVENISSDMLEKLRKGISHETKFFDQDYYTNLNLPMLNENPEVINIKDNLFISFHSDKFVKPTTDMKAFNAGIIPAGTILKDYIEGMFHRTNYIEEKLLISNCKKITGEYRFICIGNEIAGASRYQQDGRLVKNRDIPKKIYDKAHEYVTFYHPSDIFSMDLCETENGIKIVEYNCWNCSGLYAMDTESLFKKIDNYYRQVKFKNNVKQKM